MAEEPIDTEQEAPVAEPPTAAPGEPDAAAPAESSPDVVPSGGLPAEADLSEIRRERDELLELARRTQADFENYRKRVARAAAESESRGRADLLERLLPVIDNLERALAAAQPMDRDVAANHIAEGVRLVYEELNGVLRGAGVESYEPAGEQFDPELHEAMMTRPGSPEDVGVVVDVLERGYRLNGRLLRPARVVVGAEGG